MCERKRWWKKMKGKEGSVEERGDGRNVRIGRKGRCRERRKEYR